MVHDELAKDERRSRHERDWTLDRRKELISRHKTVVKVCVCRVWRKRRVVEPERVVASHGALHLPTGTSPIIALTRLLVHEIENDRFPLSLKTPASILDVCRNIVGQ